MAEPWFDPIRFGALYGGIGGGVLGALGGIVGAIAGSLAPKGKGRSFVLGAFAVMTLIGMAHLALGLYALFTGQPYGIWYPLVLIGGILTVVMGGMRPALRRRYDEAAARQAAAGTLPR